MRIFVIVVILTWAIGTMMFSAHTLSYGGQKFYLHRTVAGSPTGSPHTITTARYEVPSLGFLSNTGQEIQIDQLLTQPRPVMLQFIYTTCSTTCPVLSAMFSKAQDRLSEISKDYLLISVSIDPEYDSLQQLSDYARRHNAGENWIFLTGSNEATRNLMKAFGALYPGSNKMNHLTYTFLRAYPDSQWNRIEGFLSVDELISHFTRLIAERGI